MNASGSKSSGASVKGVVPIHDQGVVEVTSVSRGASQRSGRLEAEAPCVLLAAWQQQYP